MATETPAASNADTGIAKFYTFPDAPNPMLVDFFLREKGLDVDAMEQFVDLPAHENRTPEMYKKNPQGSLPFFELKDGTILSQTIAMCEYVEEMVPTPALIGTTAIERGHTRQWQRLLEEHYVYPAFYGHRFWTASDVSAGHKIHGVYEKRFGETEGALLIPQAWEGMLTWARRRIYWLEEQKQKEAKTTEGGQASPWICGDRFTMVDIQIWTTLFFFLTCAPEQKILEEADGKLPWFQAWYDRIMERPACIACREHVQESIRCHLKDSS